MTQKCFFFTCLSYQLKSEFKFPWKCFTCYLCCDIVNVLCGEVLYFPLQGPSIFCKWLNVLYSALDVIDRNFCCKCLMLMSSVNCCWKVTMDSNCHELWRCSSSDVRHHCQPPSGSGLCNIIYMDQTAIWKVICVALFRRRAMNLWKRKTPKARPCNPSLHDSWSLCVWWLFKKKLLPINWLLHALQLHWASVSSQFSFLTSNFVSTTSHPISSVSQLCRSCQNW